MSLNKIWCEKCDLIGLALESSVSRKVWGFLTSLKAQDCQVSRQSDAKDFVWFIGKFWPHLYSPSCCVCVCVCVCVSYSRVTYFSFYFFQVSQSEGLRASRHGKTQPFQFLNFDTCIGESLLWLSAPRVSRIYSARSPFVTLLSRRAESGRETGVVHRIT